MGWDIIRLLFEIHSAAYDLLQIKGKIYKIILEQRNLSLALTSQWDPPSPASSALFFENLQ